MNLISTFKTKQNFYFKKRTKVLFAILLLFFAGNYSLKSQTTLVVPNSNEGSAFIGPYGNAARQLQLIIDDSLLTSLVGKNLTSISFRLPASTAASWPPTDLTMNSFNIYLSNSVEPADRQLDFAANVVGTQTQVRSGSLFIPAGALTIGGNPNDFSFKILFNDPYLYQDGNLLIEMRHSGTGISSRTVHAVSTSSAGYGTLFSALWQSTGAVNQGNFTYVEITADGPLGTNSVSVGSNTVIYPNPVKDVLYLKSDRDFSSFEIYNMAGQRVISQNSVSKSGVNISQIMAGGYVLKLKDKNGNVEAIPFIKK